MFWFFSKKKDNIKKSFSNQWLEIDEDITEDLEYIKIVEERLNHIKDIGVGKEEHKEIITMIVWLKNIKTKYKTALSSVDKLIQEYQSSDIKFKQNYVGNLESKKKNLELNIDSITKNIDTIIKMYDKIKELENL